MIPKTARLGAPLALLVLLATAPPAAAAEPLRWKFTKGQTHNYTVSQSMKTKSQINGQMVETTSTQKMTMTWEIKDVDAQGNASMEQTIRRVVMEIGSPQGNVQVDTGSKEEPQGPAAQLKAMFGALVGSPIKVKMSPRGEFSDVVIDPKMFETFKNMGGPMGNMFNEKSLKEMTTQATLVLPEKALARGDSWNSTKKLELPLGTMVMDNTYTLESPAPSGAEKIGVKVKMEIQPKPESPFEIKIGSQDVAGGYEFDNKAGVLAASNVQQKVQMLIKVQGMEITQDLENSVSMTLGEAKK